MLNNVEFGGGALPKAASKMHLETKGLIFALGLLIPLQTSVMETHQLFLDEEGIESLTREAAC